MMSPQTRPSMTALTAKHWWREFRRTTIRRSQDVVDGLPWNQKSGHTTDNDLEKAPKNSQGKAGMTALI